MRVIGWVRIEIALTIWLRGLPLNSTHELRSERVVALLLIGILLWLHHGLLPSLAWWLELLKFEIIILCFGALRSHLVSWTHIAMRVHVLKVLAVN